MALKISTIVLLVLLLLLPAQAADSTAGYVKTVKGTASIIRQGETITAVAGARVFKEDVLRTGPGSSLGITFLDDTIISLGASTEIALKDFEFSPAEGRLSMVIRMLRGTAVYLSGIIAKLAPKAVRFETPKANIGIRGTRFAVKVEGGSKDVRR